MEQRPALREHRHGRRDFFKTSAGLLAGAGAVAAARGLALGAHVAGSDLLRSMGRMAMYTGQMITWEQALNLHEDLTPPKYAWGELLPPPVVMPAVTRLF